MGALLGYRGMVWWLGKTRVKFIRFFHSQQWWSSCWSCHSWIQSPPRLLQYSCPLSPCQGSLACHPTLSLGSEDEKLGTICVEASICHGQDARTCMLQDEILIIKFLAVNGLATSTIRACDIPTLAYKSQNYSVKAGTFITRSFLPSALSMKVFCCLWNFVCKQLERDVAQGLAVNSDVKEWDGGERGWTARVCGVVVSTRPKGVFFRSRQRVVVELRTCNSTWTLARQWYVLKSCIIEKWVFYPGTHSFIIICFLNFVLVT